ncbi:response regulator [Paenibacillus sp. PR3]|uniref:histidine kinase n=1 Tax=Paenibacillus terricola TaxID=2763503 RepID=A0ABR8MZG7_9BACL|nr:ATP-binding protein [Paenibacillus terricola]MBD3920980.1 response regulator [Paenibacillus terricola]
MLTNKKITIIVILFLLIITGLRLTFLEFQRPIESPQAVKGVLDLRGQMFPHNGNLALDGEWAFIPYKLLIPENNASMESEQTYIQVPDAWEPYFPHHDGLYRYGTYRLRILVDENSNQSLQLRIDEIRTASAVYINGQLAARAGYPSEKPALQQARHTPYTVDLPTGGTSIDLVIQVSNHAGEGGITHAIRLGTVESIQRFSHLSINLQFMLCIVLLVHGIYAVILYLMGVANRGILYFSLLIFSAILSVLCSDEKLLMVWFSLSYELFSKIAILSYIGISAFLPPLVNNMFPNEGKDRILRWFAVYCLAYAAFVLMAPSTYAVPTIKLLLGATLLSSLAIAGRILKSANKRTQDAIYMLLGCTAVATNIVWAIIEGRTSIQMMHYPFDLIIAVFCLAAFWFKQFVRKNEQTKQLADKLQQANRQKDDFLVNTSHELRNPLHGIMNITQSVLDDVVNPATDDHRRRLELQLTVARRMSLLLDELFDVVRLNENAIRLQIGSVRIQSVVAGVLEMLRFMLGGKPVTLQVGITDALPSVKADENKLIQIMFNLLHNAIKFTDKGTITIDASIENGMAHIHIRDTGIGMDEETRNRIFLPYEQGSSNLTRAGGGFGLGLSICKQLVELHGGTIKVASISGQGTTFTFTLPLSEAIEHSREAETFAPIGHIEAEAEDEVAVAAERAETPLSIAANAEENKSKILAVDDDNINLLILSDILGAAQYRITTVNSAKDAITMLDSESFDLIISDVMMPHMSGYELTRIVRERFSVSELPILLLTARNRSEDLFAGFQAGANDYVMKPVDAWELRSRVHALTELKLSTEERIRLEAAWLQSQMQPHFIYNTLNSIAALGTMDNDRMLALLDAFSNYLRMSFDFHNSAREIPIDRELALVRSYLFIEKERFGDRLQVQWNTEADLQFLLPPLSIQTLVENAVKHGILQRARGGTIVIRIEDDSDNVNIFISDDGVGMSEDKLRQVLSPTGGDRGIGLTNTNRRLKQFYGSGLQIQSAPGEGTTVRFQIPNKQKE